jgi:hypothetical protein
VSELVVLVEGASDKAAVEALATRRGVPADAYRVVAMGGITNIGHFVHRYADHPRIAGLYDAGEERFVRSALERAGFGTDLTRDRLSALGFEVCVRDLEDELIRAVGADAMVSVIAADGRLRPFRTLQRQPFHRDRPVEAQLHRFLGSGGRRKIRYAGLLVEALDPDRVPPPLDRLVDRF